MNQLIEKLVKGGAIVHEIASQINAESIAKFFKSKLGQIIIDKKTVVRREWPFTFAVPASQWDENSHKTQDPRLKTQDFIIVQGIVDLLVKTPEGLVIIDFKTDDVSAEECAKRAELYRRQLDLYARAAAAITGSNILSKWLYFLRPAVSVEV